MAIGNGRLSEPSLQPLQLRVAGAQGYDFFKAGFTADYEAGGLRFRLFILDGGDKVEAEAMLMKYLAKLGRRPEDASSERLSLNDPNRGPVELARQGRYLAGVLNLPDRKLRIRQLKALIANLPQTDQ